jgi:hypothetical protein
VERVVLRVRGGEKTVGYIRIQVGGSFVGHYGINSVSEEFSAMENGHADAVARAIEYLASVVLPRATALDHDLHEEGEKPRDGFTPKRITKEEA